MVLSRTHGAGQHGGMNGRSGDLGERVVGGDPPTVAGRPRVTAVMPARNEARRIATTIEELRRHVDEIVVVDDASEDDTAAIAEAAGSTVVRCDARVGYVGAIVRGFNAASGEIVVTVDADGEMPVERIADLVQPIVAGAADMVQGHRSRVPRLSERIVTGIAALGGPVGDSGTGFRALRTDLARELEIPGTCICGSFALALLGRGGRLVEVPVETRTVPGRRRIAWGHLGQAIVVARMAAAVRRPGVGRSGR